MGRPHGPGAPSPVVNLASAWLRSTRHSRHIQQHHDHVDQCRNGGSPRFNHIVRRFTIQGIPHGVQVAQALQRIRNLQQWAVSIVPKSSIDFFRGRAQIHDAPPFPQMRPIHRPQNRAATSGEHTGRTLSQLIQHRLFHIAETVLAFTLKKLTDRATQTLLNHMVRIKEGECQTAGELPAYGRFTRPRQTDQGDQRVSLHNGNDLTIPRKSYDRSN